MGHGEEFFEVQGVFLLKNAGKDRQACHSIAGDRGGSLDAAVQMLTQVSVETVKQVDLLHTSPTQVNV